MDIDRSRFRGQGSAQGGPRPQLRVDSPAMPPSGLGSEQPPRDLTADLIRDSRGAVEPQTHNMRVSRKYVIAGLAVFIVFGGAGVAGLVLLKPAPLVSTAIVSQVSSTLLVPKSSTIRINKKSYTYNSTLHLLTYQLAYAGKKITVTEEPTPDAFTADSTAYTDMINSLSSYDNFDSAMGKVYLTNPPTTSSKTIQSAVLNAKGTLLLARIDTSLSKAEWQKFFTALIIVKPQ
jgi:hypothetical protein